MPAIACQRHPDQDVRLHIVGGDWLPEGGSLCFQCGVLRTETHDVDMSPMTCVPFKLSETMTGETTAATWIEIPAPELVPVPEPSSTLMLFAGALALAWMKWRWR